MNNQKFNIIEPSFFHKMKSKGECIFHDALTINGSNKISFETVKKCDKAINSSLSLMGNGNNIFEEINNRLINTINEEINNIVREINNTVVLFNKESINELEIFINEKFKIMNLFIKSFSNEKKYSIAINDFNISDNIRKINCAKENAELILMKDNKAIISQKNIFHYNHLINRVHGTINYINSKSDIIINNLNNKIDEIENNVQSIDNEDCIRKEMMEAMKVRKVVNQLKQFKEKKIFIQKSQFQIMETNKKRLFEILKTIKEYILNVIGNFRYYLEIGAFNQSIYDENILFIRNEQIRINENFKNIF